MTITFSLSVPLRHARSMPCRSTKISEVGPILAALRAGQVGMAAWPPYAAFDSTSRNFLLRSIFEASEAE